MGNASATSACEKGNQWHRALYLATSGGDMSRNAAVTAVGQALRWELAMQLRRCMLEPSLESFNASLAAHRLAQQWLRALDAWEELQQLALRPRYTTPAAREALRSPLAACNALLSSCSEAMRWRQAQRLVPTAADLTSFNSLANVLEKSRRWRLALATATAAGRRALRPDGYSLDAVLAAAQKATAWRAALQIFDQKDVESYGIVLLALKTAGKSAPLELIDELREADASILSGAVDLLLPGTKALELLDQVRLSAETWCEKSGRSKSKVAKFNEDL